MKKRTKCTCSQQAVGATAGAPCFRVPSFVFIRVNYLRCEKFVDQNYIFTSDIDIAIIFSDYDNRLDRQVELMKLTRQIDTRIEPHPFREKDFDFTNPLVNEIVSHGMEVETT